MLKTILDNKRYSFYEHFDKWEDAIEASYQPLKKEGVVDDEYIKRVIDCVKEYGPYIVISEDIAMPHSTENAKGCHDTAISFMHVVDPVDFGEDVDGEKKARLFFSLAATDHESHMKNIQELMDILMNEKLIKELLEAKGEEDFEKIVNKYE